jgi:hypothetical protein
MSVLVLLGLPRLGFLLVLPLLAPLHGLDLVLALVLVLSQVLVLPLLLPPLVPYPVPALGPAVALLGALVVIS